MEFKSIGILTLTSVILVGCGAVALVQPPPQKPSSPDLPRPPKAHYQTVEEASITKANLDQHKDANFSLKNRSKIAIMEFKEPIGSGAGSLAADQIILKLKNNGYTKVIEREQIEKILHEQKTMAKGLTKLTDLEIAKRIGRLVSADYFMFGAVTEYKSDNMNIFISKIISDGEQQRYEIDLQTYFEEVKGYDAKMSEYKGQCQTYRVVTAGHGQCADNNAYKQAMAMAYGIKFDKTKETLPSVKSLEDWEEHFAEKSKQVFASVARVGLTAKIVDVRTSKVVWVGQANLRDTRLQKGMARIIKVMIDDFTGKISI